MDTDRESFKSLFDLIIASKGSEAVALIPHFLWSSHLSGHLFHLLLPLDNKLFAPKRATTYSTIALLSSVGMQHTASPELLNLIPVHTRNHSNQDTDVFGGFSLVSFHANFSNLKHIFTF